MKMKSKFLLGMLALSSLTAKAQNPIIGTFYTPDPAPYAHGDKVYLFVDHDEENSTNFHMKDWLLFSTEDMVNWTYLGTPVTTETFAWAQHGNKAWAAQAVEYKGKWYWYVCCNKADGGDALAVAVADRPEGPWKDAIGGPLAVGFGFIDPTVFIDEDGTPYLFWGNKGFWYGKLNEDMISFADGYKQVPGYTDPKCFGELQSKMDWSIGKNRMMTQFEEAPWITKRNGTYYAVYAAGGVPEHMAYSTAPTIDGPWTYKGRFMDEAPNSFTIHGGNINFKGQDYMFYHNGLLPGGGGFCRSTAIEEFKFNEDGSFPHIPFTKEGVKPVGKINPYKRVEAETMSQCSGVKLDHAAMAPHYVTQIHEGDWIRVRCVDFKKGAKNIQMAIGQLQNAGSVDVFLDNMDGTPIASLNFSTPNQSQSFKLNKKQTQGMHDVYLRFRGTGDLFDLDWWQVK